MFKAGDAFRVRKCKGIDVADPKLIEPRNEKEEAQRGPKPYYIATS